MWSQQINWLIRLLLHVLHSLFYLLYSTFQNSQKEELLREEFLILSTGVHTLAAISIFF